VRSSSEKTHRQRVYCICCSRSENLRPNNVKAFRLQSCNYLSISLSPKISKKIKNPALKFYAQKKKNDGTWRSLAVKSLFLADGATPNSIAIFGK
jgi:hypothetical protein